MTAKSAPAPRPRWLVAVVSRRQRRYLDHSESESRELGPDGPRNAPDPKIAFVCWIWHARPDVEKGPRLRPLTWMGTSLKDLRKFPAEVKEEMGYGLFLAQLGEKHGKAKSLRGFGGSGVLEVVSDYRGDTYRAVYTVRLARAVYVLHVFQKKSKRGIGTPKRDLDLIRQRLREAEQVDAEAGTGR